MIAFFKKSIYVHILLCMRCVHQSEWVIFVQTRPSEPVQHDSPSVLSVNCQASCLELTNKRNSTLNMSLAESLNVIQLPVHLQTFSIFFRLFLIFLLITSAAWLDFIGFILVCFEKGLKCLLL